MRHVQSYIAIISLAFISTTTACDLAGDDHDPSTERVDIAVLTPATDAEEVSVLVEPSAQLTGSIDTSSMQQAVRLWQLDTGELLPTDVRFDVETDTVWIMPRAALDYETGYGLILVGLRDLNGSVVPAQETLFATGTR